MKKFNSALSVLLMSLAGSVLAGPMAGTTEEISLRLERAIDRASEQGNYRHVQVLRLQLAKHLANTEAYAEAARQYELLLASRPSKRDRVRYSTDLGKMRDALQDYSGAIQAFQDAIHDAPND